MTRILHLSDLHFGKERPGLLRPLITTANALAPDLVAISGDLTQRARPGQFRAARTFIAALEAPVLAVPGNHDTPLHDVFERLFTPWRRYRRYIAEDLEPSWEDDEVSVHGVNTVNPLYWQRGHIGRGTTARLCRTISADPERLHILVGHHPLEHLPDTRKRLASGAERALAALESCGAGVVLSGHLHLWRVGPFRAFGGLLLVQAGTGLSTRMRGEPNDFNLLTAAPDHLVVEQFAADDDTQEFSRRGRTTFRRSDGQWTEEREGRVRSVETG
jgi:3',5'-cyclic AMP phosphodiesterase CpdA